MNTQEQSKLIKSLLDACKTAGIENPKFVAQDQDGVVMHHHNKPSREGWGYIWGDIKGFHANSIIHHTHQTGIKAY